LHHSQKRYDAEFDIDKLTLNNFGATLNAATVSESFFIFIVCAQSLSYMQHNCS